MSKKILIIGGVAGGATAATRLRRLSEDDEIVIFEKGEYISFANCGLPYYVGNKITDRDNLLVQTIPGMKDRFNLDVRNFSEVTSIDPKNNQVTVFDSKNNREYQESFDDLIISTGAKVIVPNIPGLKYAKNVFTLRNMANMDDIMSYLDNHSVKTATVIGGGFVGLEMMENLQRRGLKTQLVEQSNQVMPNLDFEMAQQLHQEIEKNGVELYLNNGLKEVTADGQKLVLHNGTELSSDITILSIGVTPASKLAQDSGISLGIKNSIKVNQRFQTNFSNIYAIGDVIQTKNFIDNSDTNVPLASPANRQGRLVADVINDLDVDYGPVQATSIAKVFGPAAASTGMNERTLKEKNIPYRAIHIHTAAHATYYPDAQPLNLKLLFSDQGKILGAQAVGNQGADKRIDVISTAMKLNATAPQLAELELTYAPPFGVAKDPINVLGYVAQNVLDGEVKTADWSKVNQLVADKAFIVDVRDDDEYAAGHVENSHLIPLNQIRDRLSEFPKDQPIYTYCKVGLRGYTASRILKNNGYDVTNIDGGFTTYYIAKYEPRHNA